MLKYYHNMVKYVNDVMNCEFITMIIIVYNYKKKIF